MNANMKQVVEAVAHTTKVAQRKHYHEDPTVCYEVWFEDLTERRQMVAAYWDVMTAWRVMEAINETNGNLGVAEVGVASGYEMSVATLVRIERTDVLGKDGRRCSSAEDKAKS